MKLKSTILAALVLFTFSCKQKTETTKVSETEISFNDQVTDYIQKFSYQDTHNYMAKYTGSDPAKLNTWILGQTPVLVKAGQDKVVRMNNDTYYKMAFVDLSNGPVTLNSTTQTNDRFSSFQLMDDHNTNYRNVINPNGTYVLYNDETPTDIEGELLKVPSMISVVVVRVEVKDMNNAKDVESAKSIFKGITIMGPAIETFPKLDLFSTFDEKVIEHGNTILDSIIKVVPFRLTVSSPEQLDKEVPVINHSAGTKAGWGGPLTSHSSYETIFSGANGELLNAIKGDYTVTFDTPPVDAFWSLTVYDTERGGFLHPNKDNRYHINGTSALPNEDGTYTFLFKTSCSESDKNCLEIPKGQFDIVARYYLPNESIQSGEWELPKLSLVK